MRLTFISSLVGIYRNWKWIFNERVSSTFNNIIPKKFANSHIKLKLSNAYICLLVDKTSNNVSLLKNYLSTTFLASFVGLFNFFFQWWIHFSILTGNLNSFLYQFSFHSVLWKIICVRWDIKPKTFSTRFFFFILYLIAHQVRIFDSLNFELHNLYNKNYHEIFSMNIFYLKVSIWIIQEFFCFEYERNSKTISK